MSEPELKLSRAKKADNQAWNRAKKKIIKTPEYTSLAEHLKEQFLENQRETFLLQRSSHGRYSQISVRTEFMKLSEISRQMKEKKDNKRNATVAHLEYELGITNGNDDWYWDTTDDEAEDDPMDVQLGQVVKHATATAQATSLTISTEHHDTEIIRKGYAAARNVFDTYLNAIQGMEEEQGEMLHEFLDAQPASFTSSWGILRSAKAHHENCKDIA